MSLNIRKFFNGLKIEPKAAPTIDALGEFEVLDSTNKAYFNNGTSSSALVTEDHPATLTNKTLVDPIITGASLAIQDQGSAFDLVLTSDSDPVMTADRTLTFDVSDADRSIDLNGDLVFADDFSTSGAFPITLTATGATSVTLPTSGTLITDTGTETLTNKTIDVTLNTINGFTPDQVVISDGSGEISSEAALSPVRGGTGVSNNAASTLTISGAFATALTVTGATAVTLPTTGTLATLAGLEVFTNKDIDGGTAADDHRITLPKNTTTNLNALTRKEATLVYDTTVDVVKADDGVALFDLIKTATSPGVTGQSIVHGTIVSNGALQFKKLIAGANITLTPSTDAITIAGTGGGGGGGGTAGIEVLASKTEYEHQFVYSEPFSNSLALSGQIKPDLYNFNFVLFEDYTASDPTIKVVIAPQFANPADPNMDSDTGWGAFEQAGNITTSATAKVGAASISFDKTGTANALAEIRYDRGSNNFNIHKFTDAYMWANIPNASVLAPGSPVYARVIDTGGTKSLTKIVTTQYDGSPLVNGWNLFYFDFATATPSGGALLTDSYRYVGVGFAVSVITTLVTGFLVDGLMFGYNDGAKLGFIGNELSIYDDTNKEDLIFPNTNTTYSGEMTLSTPLANSYTAGTGSTHAVINRATLEFSNQHMNFNDLLAGAAEVDQELRYGSIFRNSQSGDFSAIVDLNTSQYYEVLSVAGGSIDVEDFVDTSADVVSGNLLHVFRPFYMDGSTYYIYQADLAVTSSSWSSDVLTVVCTPGATAAGDIVVKKHIVSSLSMVAGPTDDESYSVLAEDSSPDGIQMFSTAIQYPNLDSVAAHYDLGGLNNTLSTRNKVGILDSLTLNGSINQQNDYLNGKFSAGTFSDLNYYSLTSAQSTAIKAGTGAPTVSGSFWINITGAPTLQRLIGVYDGPGSSGWVITWDNVTQTISLGTNVSASVTTSNTLVPGTGWHHIAFYLGTPGNPAIMWLDGIATMGTQGTTTTTNTSFGIGNVGLGNAPLTSYMADMIFWSGGPGLNQTDVDNIYNIGKGRLIGFYPMLRYQYTANGLTGQKASLKIELERETDAVNPYVQKSAVIKH